MVLLPLFLLNLTTEREKTKDEKTKKSDVIYDRWLTKYVSVAFFVLAIIKTFLYVLGIDL